MKAALASCAVCSVCALLVFGCTKKDPEPTKTEPSAAPSASAPATASATPSAANPVPPINENSIAGIMEKLAEEQKNRPTVQPSAEKVFDTITGKLAIPVENKKQIAAFTSGARYCSMGMTKHDVYLVVCEYADPESATKGVERTSSTNKVIKRREVLRRNSTTLAIQQSGETKEAEAEAKKIHDAFVAL